MDVDTNIHYAALLKVVRDLPKPEVMASAIRDLAISRDSNGGITLVRLMGDLGWSEFVPPLVTCIDDKCGDFLCEAAADALLKIGEPARDELIARWDELDGTQQIYGGSVVIRVGGTPVADFVLGRSDELMQKGAEQWCRFVLAAPDPRLVEMVRAKLPLDHPEINEAAYCLFRLLNSNDPALPGLRERIMLRRARQQRRSNALFAGDASPSDKPELELRCLACNDVNLYEVGQVMCDPTPEGMAYLIADEFPCKACGQTADFELEASAQMALIAESLRMMGAAAAGIKPDSPRIAQLKVTASDGSVQSVERGLPPTAGESAREPAGLAVVASTVQHQRFHQPPQGGSDVRAPGVRAQSPPARNHLQRSRPFAGSGTGAGSAGSDEHRAATHRRMDVTVDIHRTGGHRLRRAL